MENTRVGPIGVGEVLRRVIGKVIGWVLKGDILVLLAPQETTGLQGEGEVAIHAVKTIFEDDKTEAGF